MSKLTQSKFKEVAENFPSEWPKDDLSGLKKHLEYVFTDFESQYIFQRCFFDPSDLHITIFSEGNAFILTVKMTEISTKPVKEMTAPTPKPWYVRFWS